jgi:hypothetical protein
MADSISDLAAKSGVSVEQAEKGLGAILAWFKEKLPADSFSKVLSAIPNASNLMPPAQAPQEGSSGGILSAVGHALSKLVGGSASELTNRFAQLGFSADQFKQFLPKVSEFLTSKLPGDVMKQASALLPKVGTES